jgi:HSP20 family protein
MHIRDLIPWSRRRQDVPARSNGGRPDGGRAEGADPVFALQANINRAFEDFWRTFNLPMVGGFGTDVASVAAPRIDVRETDNAIEVTAELPGIEDADVEISIDEEALTIRGERKVERQEGGEEGGYVVRERGYGRFERVVPLPDGVDIDSAAATFKNGVLKITIPKTAEAQAAVRHIPVQHS